jgi:hypothetical protein
MAKRPSDLPPKAPKREIPPAPGSAFVGRRRQLTPAARLGSQIAALVLVLVVIGIFVYPLVRPIISPDPVTKYFGQLTTDQQKAINSLPAEQRDMLLRIAEKNPPQAIDTAVAVIQPPVYISDDLRFFVPGGATPSLVLEKPFTRINVLYGAEGQAQLYQSGSSYYLYLSNVSVTPGPELHIGFAPEAAPDIATRDTWLDLGPLKGQTGTIAYALPPTFNLANYKSVVIFDAKYSTLNSVAVIGS